MTGKIYFMANLDSYSKDAMYDDDLKKILAAIFLATIYQNQIKWLFAKLNGYHQIFILSITDKNHFFITKFKFSSPNSILLHKKG